MGRMFAFAVYSLALLCNAQSVSTVKPTLAVTTSSPLLIALPKYDLTFSNAVTACATGCRSYFDGCNTCVCDANGKSAACTKKLCVSALNADNPPRCLDSSSEVPSTPTCPKGCSNWNDGCNDCTCNPDGTLGACTRRMCFTIGEPKCNDPPANDKNVCPDADCEMWFDGCNNCSCSEKGMGCTRKFCEVKEKPKCLKVKGKKPEPQAEQLTVERACKSGCKTFYDGCNTCQCMADGTAACTQMMCMTRFDPNNKPRCIDSELPVEEPSTELVDPLPAALTVEEACKSGCKTFYDGCNTCQCMADGTAACTRMMCITRFDPNNRPRCMDDEIQHADEESVSETSEPRPFFNRDFLQASSACATGCKSYFDGCNKCQCMADGTSVCTEKMCAAVIDYDINNRPRCLDDQKQEENHTEVNSSPSLTVEEACKSGCKTFYDGCNTCQCMADGTAACTMRMCIALFDPNNRPRCMDDKKSTESEKPKETLAQIEEPQVATPEKCPDADCLNWYDGCNNCVCTDSGMTCTRRMCIRQDTPKCVLKKTVKQPVKQDFCASGCKSYFDGCNTCSCGKNGLSTCTLKFCATNQSEPRCLDKENEAVSTTTLTPVAPVLPPPESVLGVCPQNCSVWYDGCNSCVCSSKGVLGSCTKRFCLKSQKTPARCLNFEALPAREVSEAADEPQQTPKCPQNCSVWFDGCNTCQCNSDDSIGACTLKYCFFPSQTKCLEKRTGKRRLDTQLSSLRGNK